MEEKTIKVKTLGLLCSVVILCGFFAGLLFIVCSAVLSQWDHDQQFKAGEEKTLELEKQGVPVQERSTTPEPTGTIKIVKESAIALAENRKAAKEQILRDGRQFGLSHMYHNCTLREFSEIVERARNNMQLIGAIRLAQKCGVEVFVSNDKFSIEDGWVLIYTKATDEEIINFLLDP